MNIPEKGGTLNQTEGEIQIHAILKVRLFDLVTPIVLILRTNLRLSILSDYIIEIQTMLVLLE